LNEGSSKPLVFLCLAMVCPFKGHLVDQLNTRMLIREVTPPTAATAQQQQTQRLRTQAQHTRDQAQRLRAQRELQRAQQALAAARQP
jgi:hypothetical protein